MDAAIAIFRGTQFTQISFYLRGGPEVLSSVYPESDDTGDSDSMQIKSIEMTHLSFISTYLHNNVGQFQLILVLQKATNGFFWYMERCK
jgi:hypothetical protein